MKKFIAIALAGLTSLSTASYASETLSIEKACKNLQLDLYNCNKDNVKTNYRQLAIKLHPDKNNGSTRNEFVTLTDSKDLLMKYFALHGEDLRTLNNENFLNLDRKILEFLEQNLAGMADNITIKKLAKDIGNLPSEKERVNALTSAALLSGTHDIKMVKYALQFTSDNAVTLLKNLAVGNILPKNEASMLHLLNFTKELDNARRMEIYQAVGNAGSIDQVLASILLLSRYGQIKDLEKVLDLAFKYSRNQYIQTLKPCFAKGWFGKAPSDDESAKCVQASLKSHGDL